MNLIFVNHHYLLIQHLILVKLQDPQSINNYNTYKWIIASSADHDPSVITKLYNVLEPEPDDENEVHLSCVLTRNA